MSKRRTKNSPVLIIIILLLVAVLIYSGFRVIDSFVSSGNVETESISSSKTITRDGIQYYPRQDITVLMILGIDERGEVKASESYNNKGEADMVALAVFDEADKSYSILLLNRDTMVDVPVLGVGGKSAGTAYEQLALAHTYGSGLEDSCENTKKAVSDFLYGLSVDYYLSMNMDAIAILNDAVGGVKVNVTDDFSSFDSSIPMGETVLKGEQAITFVQTRKDMGNQMNISRMERHKAYMSGFMSALNDKLQESDSFIIDTFDSVDEYMVTDCSVNTLSTLINRYSDYTLKEIVSPQGENVMGDSYMEFYADEDALDELILNLFYSEK